MNASPTDVKDCPTEVTQRREGRDADRSAGPHMDDDAFRLFVESVADYAIFMLDSAGRIATWNHGAERIKGYAAADVVGQPFSLFYLPEDVAAGKPDRDLEEAAREGRLEEEGWRVRKDGSRFWASIIISAVRSARGELLGFGKVTRDLSQSKRAEQERLAVAARDEGLRAREELLVITAHELRNPIAALQLNADLVRRLAERGDARGPERLADRVRHLHHSATRLSRLVDAVLRVAILLEPRELDLDRRDLELRALVGAVVEDHRADAAAAGCTVEVEQGPPVVAVGDRALVEVAVGNLLANAFKYGPKQPVTLRVELRDERAILSIRDRGTGIPAERQAGLFDRFRRGGISTRQYGGLGLGLWTVRAIAEAHGGAVRLVSQAGEGSTFEVDLPAAQASSVARTG